MGTSIGPVATRLATNSLSGKARTVTATGDTRIILCGIAQTLQLKAQWMMKVWTDVCIGYLPLIPCQDSTTTRIGRLLRSTRHTRMELAKRMVTIAFPLDAARGKAADVM